MSRSKPISSWLAVTFLCVLTSAAVILPFGWSWNIQVTAYMSTLDADNNGIADRLQKTVFAASALPKGCTSGKPGSRFDPAMCNDTTAVISDTITKTTRICKNVCEASDCKGYDAAMCD